MGKTAAVMMMTLALAGCAEKVNAERLTLYARGAELYRGGNFSAAVPLLRGAGDFPQALLLRGKCEYFLGDAAAEQTLRRVLRKNGSPEAALYLARICRRRGEEGKAAEYIAKALAAAPSDVGALRLQAAMALEHGDRARAAALLDMAADASAEAAMVFLDRARLRWISGRAGDALADLDRAIILLPPGSALVKPAADLRKTIEGKRDEEK